MKIQALWSGISLMLIGILCQSETCLAVHTFNLFEAGSEYRFVSGKNSQTNHEAEFHLNYRYFQKHSLGFSIARLARSYSGTRTRTDWVWGAQQVAIISKSFYFEADGTYISDPKFREKWSASITPHLIIEKFGDFALRTQVRHYFSENSYSLRGSWQKEWPKDIQTGISADTVVKPVFTASGSAYLEKGFAPFYLRASFAAGKSYEGEGLKDRFVQSGVKVGFDFTKFASIYLDGNLYRGKIRKENRVGGGLQCFF